MNKFQVFPCFSTLGEINGSHSTLKNAKENYCLDSIGWTVSGVTQKYLLEYDKDVEYEYDIEYNIPLNMIKDASVDVDFTVELAFPPPEGTRNSKGPACHILGQMIILGMKRAQLIHHRH